NSHDVARINPARRPITGSNNRPNAHAARTTDAQANSAGKNRALASLTPPTRMAIAFNQNVSGGLLKYGSPRECSVTQSPVVRISLATCACQASSQSLNDVAPRRAKKTQPEKTERTTI